MNKGGGGSSGDRTLYLVRHARAGKRNAWKGPDALRPLSGKGRRQAEGLVPMLDDAVKRILSSPAVRCVQTVEPLAHHVGLEVETTHALAEGASAKPAVDLIRSLPDEVAVLCAHGDLMPKVLGWFATHGAEVDCSQSTAKGAVWMLHIATDQVTSARYLPPPG